MKPWPRNSDRRSRKACRLINKVKDITYEYLSMERLLYNQILLENLIKDYRWNNPALYDIQNSEVINKLRNG